jgi:opacity protein-like surface antigen
MSRLNIVLITITSLFSSIVNASITTNLYFGMGAGVTMGTVKTELTYPTDQPIPTSATYNYSLAAYTPRISLGYQHLLNKRWGVDTVLSAEFNAGAAITKVNDWFPDPATNSYTNATLSLVYALDVLAFYNLNAATTIFFGPGVALGEFKSTSNVTGGVTGISGKYSKNLIGSQFMAGVDLFLTNTSKLRLSDTYTLYPTVSTTWVEPISNEPFAGRYTLSMNTVMVGVLFDF